MSTEDQQQLAGFVAGLLLGATIGASVAILMAPQSGKKTRRALGKAASGTRKRIEKTAVELGKTTRSGLDDFTDEVRTRADKAITGSRKKLGLGK